jgi:Cu-Zn family superoxide dismutase
LSANTLAIKPTQGEHGDKRIFTTHYDVSCN